jgi:hypothetical protein
VIEYHVIGKIMEEKCFIEISDSWRIDWFNDYIELPCEIDKCATYCVPANTFNFKKETRLKEYKECFTIISEREFKTDDIIQYNNKDYKVKYKYNKELEQHQLYIDYIIETVKLNDDVIQNYKTNFENICEYKNSTSLNKSDFINKIKRIFKRT